MNERKCTCDNNDSIDIEVSSSSTSLLVECEVKLKIISNDKENGRIVVVAVISFILRR